MADTDTVRKLQLKPGSRLLVMGDPGDYAERLAAAGDLALVDGGPADAGLLFAPDRAAFRADAPALVAAVPRPGLVWVAYRKVPKSDLNRNGVLELASEFGWTPVTQIAIDDTWSGMRIRPLDEVGR